MSRIINTPCEERRAKVLIFQDKQRENVENAGRVNKRRKEFTAKQSPSTVMRLIYRKTFAAVTCEDPAGRAVVSISPAVVFDLLK